LLIVAVGPTLPGRLAWFVVFLAFGPDFYYVLICKTLEFNRVYFLFHMAVEGQKRVERSISEFLLIKARVRY